MTLDEKLEQFYNVTIESATVRNIEIVEEYEKSLEKVLEEHKKDTKQKADENYRLEAENLLREKNRLLSAEAINVKRKLNDKVLELIDNLFEDVMDKLQTFMKTKEYETLLISQIKHAKEFSREDDIKVYINPSDQHLKEALEKATGVPLTISQYDFIGGSRAVITEKNILIDNSFTSKIEEAKESFVLKF